MIVKVERACSKEWYEVERFETRETKDSHPVLGQEGEVESRCLRISLFMKNSRMEDILLIPDSRVFIMNNEGETIDRIYVRP